MKDINNSTYANAGWYPDYIQTIFYKPNFCLKVIYLIKNIIIPIKVRKSILIIIIIIIIIIMIKVSKHNNDNSNHKDINKDITKIVIIVIIN